MKICYNMPVLYKICSLEFAEILTQRPGEKRLLQGREIKSALPMGTFNKIVSTLMHNVTFARKILRVSLAVLFLVLFLSAAYAHALGTPVGTMLINQATAHYTVGANNYSTLSNATTIRVDDKVSFTLTASDSSNVTILANNLAYMTYVLTNTGNGAHDFTLITTPTGTNNLTPNAGPAFYSDQPGTVPLPLNASAGNLPCISNLASNGTATIYLYIAAPATPTDGQAVAYVVTAEAYQTGTGTKSSTQAGTDLGQDKNTSPNTVYVVLADGIGSGSSVVADINYDGKYTALAKDGGGNTVGFKVQSGSVNVGKTATVTDQYGGSKPMTGSTIHYTLAVTVTGSGTAMNVVIADPIPANTTYIAGTLKLNNAALTDAADLDAGDVGGTTPGTVTVKLGNLTSTSLVQTVTFDVKIN
jgi:uncharacterized repeat protein (TIGR01451 family)